MDTLTLSELVLGLRDLWSFALSFNEINAITKTCCQRLSKQWFFSLIAPEIVFRGYFFWFSYPNCSIDKIIFHTWREFQCHKWCQVIKNKWRRPQVNPTNTHSDISWKWWKMLLVAAAIFSKFRVASVGLNQISCCIYSLQHVKNIQVKNIVVQYLRWLIWRKWL